jgi:hypothetical protein
MSPRRSVRTTIRATAAVSKTTATREKTESESSRSGGKWKLYRGTDLLRLCEQYAAARREQAGSRSAIRDGAPRVFAAYKALSDYWSRFTWPKRAGGGPQDQNPT